MSIEVEVNVIALLSIDNKGIDIHVRQGAQVFIVQQRPYLVLVFYF